MVTSTGSLSRTQERLLKSVLGAMPQHVPGNPEWFSYNEQHPGISLVPIK